MAAPDGATTAPEVDGKRFAFEAGRIYSKPAMALLATAVLYAVVAVLGECGRREMIVILVSVVSLPVLFYYPLLTPRDGAKPSRGLLGVLVGLGSFVAYGLGCFLTFYEGLWGLVRLFSGFSFSSLVWSLASCVLGFAIVDGMYRLTELCRAVDEGRLIVRRSA